MAGIVSELDCIALSRRQRRKGGSDATGLLASQHIGDNVLGGGQGRELFKRLLTTLPTRGPSQPIESAVTHDPAEPRPHRATPWIVPVGVPPDGKERVLHHLLSSAPILHDAVRQRKG